MESKTTVIIHSTEELPTPYDKGKGTVWKRHHKYKEFVLVLVWSVGETSYFHESQLEEH